MALAVCVVYGGLEEDEDRSRKMRYYFTNNRKYEDLDQGSSVLKKE